MQRLLLATEERLLSALKAQVWHWVQVGVGADWPCAITAVEETINKEKIAKIEIIFAELW
jgi:hypothetical protein